MDPFFLWLILGAAALLALAGVGVAASTKRAKINRGRPMVRDEPGQPFNRENPFTDSGDTEKGKRP